MILLGEGPSADAKRRLLDRAGAVTVGEAHDAALAIVAIEDEAQAHAAIERLKARGILVNAVDRPALCDFTLPAIVDRSPVLVAIGTGGASAGLAKALRQRLEALLPASLGTLAGALHGARAGIRTRWPRPDDRRRAIDAALAPGGALDPLREQGDQAVSLWLDRAGRADRSERVTIILRSSDPDDLTLREARLLGEADRVIHAPEVPKAILERARADAERVPEPADAGSGLTVILRMARA